jgi:hypothetical protein
MSDFVAYSPENVKEAVEREEEGRARVKEAYIRKLGSKDAAEKYLAERDKRNKRGR